ncbi:hypothetical protein [Aquimarina hainanensis]|uniref:hypothetical protein n=1 Tax=Aquimarina hainanensis TaxID=1578017 RepID=UPI00361FACA5
MNNSVRVEIPLSTKLSIGTRVRYRNTKNDITRNEASLNDGQVGLSNKFNGRITLLARGELRMQIHILMSIWNPWRNYAKNQTFGYATSGNRSKRRIARFLMLS